MPACDVIMHPAFDLVTTCMPAFTKGLVPLLLTNHNIDYLERCAPTAFPAVTRVVGSYCTTPTESKQFCTHLDAFVKAGNSFAILH